MQGNTQLFLMEDFAAVKKNKKTIPQSASDYTILWECHCHANEFAGWPEFWYCNFIYNCPNVCTYWLLL